MTEPTLCTTESEKLPFSVYVVRAGCQSWVEAQPTLSPRQILGLSHIVFVADALQLNFISLLLNLLAQLPAYTRSNPP